MIMKMAQVENKLGPLAIEWGDIDLNGLDFTSGPHLVDLQAWQEDLY